MNPTGMLPHAGGDSGVRGDVDQFCELSRPLRLRLQQKRRRVERDWVIVARGDKVKTFQRFYG